MKHVDEGLLHAYLDDAFGPGEAFHTRIRAHLTLCGECRARLEEARQLRELAAVIVEDLGPPEKIVAPAELRLAAAEDPHPRKAPTARAALHPRGWLPLAWAASILLALAGGWFAGERWQAAEHLAETRAGRLAEAGSLSSEVIHLPDSDFAQIPQPPTDEPPPSPPVAEAASPAAPGREVPETLQAEPVLLPEVTPRLAASQDPALPQQPARAAAPRALSPPELAVAPLPRAAEIAPARPSAEARRGREAVAAERTVAGPLPETPPTSPRAGPARGGPRPPLRTAPGGMGPTTSFPSPRSSAAQREASWRPVFRSDAEQRLGEPLAYVEGLAISGVWIAREGSGWKARLTQPLAGGGVLELIQRPAGTGGEHEPLAQATDPDEAHRGDLTRPLILRSSEAGAGGATVLLLLRPGGPMLSLTAPLPREALLELAARVRVGKP